MKIMITGSSGMLGKDLMEALRKENILIGTTSKDFDISDIGSTVQAIQYNRPDLIIHSAAYTDVDGCKSNIDTAYKVNGLGTRNVAVACNEINAAMVYISTDYVFDGMKGQAYIEYDFHDFERPH